MFEPQPHITPLMGLPIKILPGGTILEASCMRKGSNAWQSIIGARDFILRGACWRVGDGKTIKVWKNRWLPENHHRKVLSPIPTSLRNSCASELLLPPLQGWNIAMINQLFPPCDAKAILSIPVSERRPPDKLVWPGLVMG